MRKKRNSERVFVNRDIRAKEVRCIDQHGDNLGVLKTYEAIQRAQDAGLDLVMVTQPAKNKIPTCKILDSGKYKYDLAKRKKDQAKKQRESAVKLKEIKFRPCTDVNDLRTKARKAEKFLEEGSRVKVVINFKGREMTHSNIAEARLKEFIEFLGEVEIYESPRMSGRQMSCVLAAKKELSKAS